MEKNVHLLVVAVDFLGDIAHYQLVALGITN